MTLRQSWLIASMVKDMPLAECLQAARHSEAMGAIFDPTLWRDNVGKLQQDIQVMEALLELQSLVRSMAVEASR